VVITKIIKITIITATTKITVIITTTIEIHTITLINKIILNKIETVIISRKPLREIPF